MEKNESPYFLIFLFASLGLHAALVLALMLAPGKNSVTDNQPIEIAFDSENSANSKNVVRSVPVPKDMLTENNEKSQYWSEERRRVKEQTQSAFRGKTQNAGGTPNSSSPSTMSNEPEKDLEQDPDSISSETAKKRKEYQTFPGFAGVSRTGESLNNVKIGNMTALNTDRFTFYSFYARVEDLTRYNWENKIAAAIDRVERGKILLRGKKNWITQIEFILSPDGRFERALLLRESGLPDFDLAAINAFKDARIFPNPPPEMVESDGKIHIRFAFDVEYTPPVLVNSNNSLVN